MENSQFDFSSEKLIEGLRTALLGGSISDQLLFEAKDCIQDFRDKIHSAIEAYNHVREPDTAEQMFWELVGGPSEESPNGGWDSRMDEVVEAQRREISHDPVAHPSHYTDGRIEVWDFIADKRLGYFRGNAVKYLCRAGKKDPEKEREDLQKALQYIQKELELLEE